jgi:hypothetical protein
MELIFGSLIWIFIILWVIKYLSNKRKCAWCDGRKLKFVSGKEGDWFWQYRKKDGSQDKRVKDNYQQAGYRSIYDCLECSASTAFTHFATKKPSKKVEIWKRVLFKKGPGERKGKDWSNDGSVIDTKSANRKNN